MAKSIKFKNDTYLDSSNIVHNRKELNEYLTPNAIMVGITNNKTITTAGVNKLDINKEILKIGNNLTLSNKKVIIGSGIRYVEISAKLNATIKSSGAKNLIIYKNGNEIINGMNSSDSVTSQNLSIPVPNYIVEVQEGDYFEFACYLNVNDVVMSTIERTYLCIKELKF